MADTGHGSTVTFGTSTWTGEVLTLQAPVHSREELDATHLGSTTYNETLPGDTVKLEPSPISFQFDADEPLPYSAVDELITITFKSGAKFAGTGRIMTFTPPELGTNQKMVASGVISWSGANVAWTAAP